ncbi:MAG: hypothetical protein LBB48_07285 [Treponema sp.]|nr:hypothetical protein [Treponema sp.]
MAARPVPVARIALALTMREVSLPVRSGVRRQYFLRRGNRADVRIMNDPARINARRRRGRLQEGGGVEGTRQRIEAIKE